MPDFSVSGARNSCKRTAPSDSEKLESQRKGAQMKLGVKGIARAAMSKARTICLSGEALSFTTLEKSKAELRGSALRFGFHFTRTVSVDNQVNDRE